MRTVVVRLGAGLAAAVAARRVRRGARALPDAEAAEEQLAVRVGFRLLRR